jgi:hypothetical protein
MAYKNFQNRPYVSSYRRRSLGRTRDQQYRNRKFYKNPPAEHRFLASIFSGLGNIISLPFRRKGISVNDKKIIIKRWYWIRQMLSSGENSDLRSAVIEADKLMDFGLKSAHFSGHKFADRIRAAKSFYPKKVYSGIWQAHILRNELVHNLDSKINSYQAKDAIKNIGAGLKAVKGL